MHRAEQSTKLIDKLKEDNSIYQSDIEKIMDNHVEDLVGLRERG